MSEFDGMEPVRVRVLLAQVGEAAVKMRTLEGKIGTLVRGAGLATATAHRPSQVADACDKLVTDVKVRLETLEKREFTRADGSAPKGHLDPAKPITPDDPAKDPSSKDPGKHGSPDHPKDTKESSPDHPKGAKDSGKDGSPDHPKDTKESSPDHPKGAK